MKQGVEAAMERRPDDSDADFELRKKMVEQQVAQLEQLMAEANQLTIGLLIDQKTKSVFGDMTVTAVAGSKLAQRFAAAGEDTTNLVGFTDAKAAFSAGGAGKFEKSDLDQAIAQLNTAKGEALKQIDANNDLPNDEAKKVVKEMLESFFGVVQATLESGKVDFGASVKIDEKSLTAVAGAHVAKSADLDALLRKLAKIGKEQDANFPDVKFEAETHKGVKIHTVSIPVPQNEPAAKVFGQNLDVAIGIGKDLACLSIGNDAVSALKGALDKSGTPSKVAGPQMHVSLVPILKFAAAQGADPNVAMLADMLEKSGGGDKISLLAKAETNGVSYRLEIQEGVLKAIGQAAILTRAGQAGGNIQIEAQPVPEN
jgi:hypothetical protein